MCVHKMCLLCLSETTLQRVNDLRYCKQHLVVTMQKPEVITKKIEHEKDVEKRKNNVIIYKVAEVNADNATDRNESDSAFVTELLDSVFKIKPEHSGIVRTFRLGRWDSSKETPRPLLIEFKDHESKEQVMSNLKYLRDAEAP